MTERSGLWILGGAALGFVLTAALLGITRLRGVSSQSAISPVMTIIPRPSATAPEFVAPSATLSAEATSTPIPGAPKRLVRGELVEVYGTEGEGLRIRQDPNLNADILLLGLESEVFEVVDGPVTADGYVWWELANPFDPSKRGWAVDPFLRSLEGSP